MTDTAERKKIRYIANKKRYDEYRSTLKCMDCGISDPRVIQLHHRDGEGVKRLNTGKRIGVTMMMSTYAWLTIKEELDKREPLCANCHIIRHYRSGESNTDGSALEGDGV